MSYFNDNEDRIIYGSGRPFRRKACRQRVEVTADDFKDLGPLSADTAEILLREAVRDADPYYTPRGAKHGDQWCRFCGSPKMNWKYKSPSNHNAKCTWLRTQRFFSTKDLV